MKNILELEHIQNGATWKYTEVLIVHASLLTCGICHFDIVFFIIFLRILWPADTAAIENTGRKTIRHSKNYLVNLLDRLTRLVFFIVKITNIRLLFPPHSTPPPIFFLQKMQTTVPLEQIP